MVHPVRDCMHFGGGFVGFAGERKKHLDRRLGWKTSLETNGFQVRANYKRPTHVHICMHYRRHKGEGPLSPSQADNARTCTGSHPEGGHMCVRACPQIHKYIYIAFQMPARSFTNENISTVNTHRQLLTIRTSIEYIFAHRQHMKTLALHSKVMYLYLLFPVDRMQARTHTTVCLPPPSTNTPLALHNICHKSLSLNRRRRGLLAKSFACRLSVCASS